ncbi:hypothetical protein LINGRAHAP2_LOCUS16732, partial [Linum grandiflorum]
IKVEHIYREGNRPTDYLADLNILPIGIHSVSTVDLMLSIHLLYDLFGVPQPRER